MKKNEKHEYDNERLADAIADKLNDEVDAADVEFAIDTFLPFGVVRAIVNERNFQDRKWGTVFQHPHTVAEWLMIMESELQEAKEKWFDELQEETIKALVKVLSVGVACLVQHGVYEPVGEDNGIYTRSG